MVNTNFKIEIDENNYGFLIDGQHYIHKSFSSSNNASGYVHITFKSHIEDDDDVYTKILRLDDLLNVYMSKSEIMVEILYNGGDNKYIEFNHNNAFEPISIEIFHNGSTDRLKIVRLNSVIFDDYIPEVENTVTDIYSWTTNLHPVAFTYLRIKLDDNVVINSNGCYVDDGWYGDESYKCKLKYSVKTNAKNIHISKSIKEPIKKLEFKVFFTHPIEVGYHISLTRNGELIFKGKVSKTKETKLELSVIAYDMLGTLKDVLLNDYYFNVYINEILNTISQQTSISISNECDNFYIPFVHIQNMTAYDIIDYIMKTYPCIAYYSDSENKIYIIQKGNNANVSELKYYPNGNIISNTKYDRDMENISNVLKVNDYIHYSELDGYANPTDSFRSHITTLYAVKPSNSPSDIPFAQNIYALMRVHGNPKIRAGIAEYPYSCSRIFDIQDSEQYITNGIYHIDGNYLMAKHKEYDDINDIPYVEWLYNHCSDESNCNDYSISSSGGIQGFKTIITGGAFRGRIIGQIIFHLNDNVSSDQNIAIVYVNTTTESYSFSTYVYEENGHKYVKVGDENTAIYVPDGNLTLRIFISGNSGASNNWIDAKEQSGGILYYKDNNGWHEYNGRLMTFDLLFRPYDTSSFVKYRFNLAGYTLYGNVNMVDTYGTYKPTRISRDDIFYYYTPICDDVSPNECPQSNDKFIFFDSESEPNDISKELISIYNFDYACYNNSEAYCSNIIKEVIVCEPYKYGKPYCIPPEANMITDIIELSADDATYQLVKLFENVPFVQNKTYAILIWLDDTNENENENYIEILSSSENISRTPMVSWRDDDNINTHPQFEGISVCDGSTSHNNGMVAAIFIDYNHEKVHLNKKVNQQCVDRYGRKERTFEVLPIYTTSEVENIIDDILYSSCDEDNIISVSFKTNYLSDDDINIGEKVLINDTIRHRKLTLTVLEKVHHIPHDIIELKCGADTSSFVKYLSKRK